MIPSQIFPSQDLNNSNKGSKISINSLQKSKDRIQQIKQQQDKIKQQIINNGGSTASNLNSSAGGASSGTKTATRYNNNSMLQDQSEDQLDKLCLNDVSLTKGGAEIQMGGT